MLMLWTTGTDKAASYLRNVAVAVTIRWKGEVETVEWSIKKREHDWNEKIEGNIVKTKTNHGNKYEGGKIEGRLKILSEK